MLIAVDRIHSPMNVVTLPQEHRRRYSVMIDHDEVTVYQKPTQTDYAVGVKTFGVHIPNDGLCSLEYVVAKFDTEDEAKKFLDTIATCIDAGVERFYPWCYNRESQEYEPPDFIDEMLLLMKDQMSKDEVLKTLQEVPTADNISRLIDKKMAIIKQRDAAVVG